MNCKSIIAPAILGLSLLFGCASQTDEAPRIQEVTTVSSQATTAGTTITTVTTTTTETTTTTTTVLLACNPLTGTKTMNPDAVGKRPVAVMVNNINVSLPQYGISAADIIYEMPVEGGITRLMAVYADYSAVPQVCSIRSCRFYFPLIALGMDAIYCHWGIDRTIALETVNRIGIEHMDGGSYYGRLYFRDEERMGHYAIEHTGYLDGPRLPEVIEQCGFRSERNEAHQSSAFRFLEEDSAYVPGEAKVLETTLHFSGGYYSTFTFDEESQCYLKQHSGKPHTDQRSQQQLSFKNVLILQSDVHPLDESNYLVYVGLEGGSGYYVSNGGMQSIRWVKPSEDAPIQIFDADAQELFINAGKTYIGILGYQHAISFYDSIQNS
ncbi:MAG: DUF3048 domain-containing protein [Oscillospiraceae bacterium]|nr:DUF3048 domain-containing protein [Oscillospiraceae bacterium]